MLLTLPQSVLAAHDTGEPSSRVESCTRHSTVCAHYEFTWDGYGCASEWGALGATVRAAAKATAVWYSGCSSEAGDVRGVAVTADHRSAGTASADWYHASEGDARGCNVDVAYSYGTLDVAEKAPCRHAPPGEWPEAFIVWTLVFAVLP